LTPSQPGGQISEFEIYGPSMTGANLASGKTMSDSGHSQTYVARNANDGNQSTYWESMNNAFPQWLQVDLGSSVSINKVALKLPASGWGSRSETLAVQGSTNGTTFADILASTGYTFDGSANIVTINFAATTTRYVRLNVTANTGWPAGHDAVGNQSAASNTVTRTGTGGTNLAPGRPISGSPNTYIYVPANANDNDHTTYFEGSTYPSTVTVSLLGNAQLRARVRWSVRSRSTG
jgi:hypothetical protein